MKSDTALPIQYSRADDLQITTDVLEEALETLHKGVGFFDPDMELTDPAGRPHCDGWFVNSIRKNPERVKLYHQVRDSMMELIVSLIEESIELDRMCRDLGGQGCEACECSSS